MTIAKVTQNTLYHLSGKVMGTLLGIATFALMARYLGQEQFGWYTTAVSFLQIAGILIDFGLVLVTGQMLSTSKMGGEKRVLHNLLAFRTITALITYVAAGAVIWFFPYNTEIKWAVLISTFAFFLIAINQIFTGIFQKHLRAGWIGLAEFAQRLALLLGVALVVFADAGFLPVMGAVVIGNIVQTIILSVRAHRLIPLGFAFDADIWKTIISKSWPIAISIAFNLIYLRADILILSLTRTQAEVGLYGAAYRIMDVTTAIPIIFMGLLLPLLSAAWAAHDHARFSSLLRQGFSIFSLIATPMLFGGILLATPLMRLVAGSEFTAAGTIMQVLLVALMGGFLGALFGHAIVAINHQKKTIWIYMITAILTLAGYLVVIPHFGVMGAAWMTVFSEVLAGGLLWLYIRTKTNVRVVLTPLLKAVLASCLMVAALWPLRSANVLLLIVLGIMVYSAAIVLLRGISKNSFAALFTRG